MKKNTPSEQLMIEYKKFIITLIEIIHPSDKYDSEWIETQIEKLSGYEVGKPDFFDFLIDILVMIESGEHEGMY